MNLRTLRYFIAIADAGSFTAAAQAVSIAQPALTRQIRDLEEEMGARLLQRTPHGVRLTQVGVTFYESAQRILSEASRLRQRLTQTRIDSQATVILGTPPTLARVLMPGLFERFVDANENVTLKTREAFTPALLDWLERGVIDMAILTNPEARRGLSYQPLLGEPFALVSHPAMRVGPVVSVSQLTRLPLLMTSLHRSIVERQMVALGKQLKLQAEMDSVDAIRELVLRGKWTTIMPVSVFKEMQAPGQVVLSEISGVQLNRLLVLATRSEPDTQPAQVVVHDLLEAEFSRLVRQGIFSFGAGESIHPSPD